MRPSPRPYARRPTPSDSNRRTRTLLVSPFHFDGSYANLFPTLVSGGTAVIPSSRGALVPSDLLQHRCKREIHVLRLHPQLLTAPARQSKSSHDFVTPRSRLVALGGEAMSVTDLRSLWSKVPALRVFNRYGPTETTIAVTNVELTPAMIEGGTVHHWSAPSRRHVRTGRR